MSICVRSVLARCLAAVLIFAAIPADAQIHRSKKAIAEFKRIEPCPANGNRYGPCPGWQGAGQPRAHRQRPQSAAQISRGRFSIENN